MKKHIIFCLIFILIFSLGYFSRMTQVALQKQRQDRIVQHQRYISNVIVDNEKQSKKDDLVCKPVVPMDFSKYDLNDMDAINKIAEDFRKKYGKYGWEDIVSVKFYNDCDMAVKDFMNFLEFYDEFIDTHLVDFSYNTKHLINYPREKDQAYMINMARLLSRSYYKYGLNVYYSEWVFGIDISYSYMYEKFGAYLPSDWKAYLYALMPYDNSIDAYPGLFSVSKDEVQDFLKSLEDFKKKYPDFKYTEKLDGIIAYLNVSLKMYPKTKFYSYYTGVK